jgi:hypothetical protein
MRGAQMRCNAENRRVATESGLSTFRTQRGEVEAWTMLQLIVADNQCGAVGVVDGFSTPPDDA